MFVDSIDLSNREFLLSIGKCSFPLDCCRSSRYRAPVKLCRFDRFVRFVKWSIFLTIRQVDLSIGNIVFHLAVHKKYFKITACLRAFMKYYCFEALSR